jgi:gamma-glutamyl phosphate reductase
MAKKVLINAKLRRTSICGATETLLVDKQAFFFSQKCKENIKDFYILKIVSDYFDEKEPTNEKIFELINNSISKWKNLI